METIINLNNITFFYPNMKLPTISNCSLTVSKGELVSILGPNGAGKSTLLNCACGLLYPKEGNVSILGCSIDKMSPKKIAKIIGYVQQTQTPVFDHSVFDYILMGRANNIGLFQKPTSSDYDKVFEVLEQMNILYLAEKSITEISGGERQQAAIARAIVQEPKVILFDEPTAHLDYGNQINTLRLIASLSQKGYAIVMTTHNPDHCLMLGGTVGLLDKSGTLKVGLYKEIISSEVLSNLYKTELCLPFVDAANRVACIPKGIENG